MKDPAIPANRFVRARAFVATEAVSTVGNCSQMCFFKYSDGDDIENIFYALKADELNPAPPMINQAPHLRGLAQNQSPQPPSVRDGS
jgi:hypothetical protein